MARGSTKPNMLRETVYGLISDLHGHATALRAVLHALEERQVDAIYAAGDLLLGGDAPMETWQLLRDHGVHCIRGASDTALTRYRVEDLPAQHAEEAMEACARFGSTQDRLGDLIIERLRRLPDRLRVPLIHGGEMLIVHGSPSDPLEDMTHVMDDEALSALIDDDPADIIVCGGSHVPFQRTLPAHVVVNVGSVGAAPGGDVAHYTLLTCTPSGVQIEQDHVLLGRDA